ncbi:MAG: hypothetical protein ACM3SQ_03835 [Betaproteobacteria bacterium]
MPIEPRAVHDVVLDQISGKRDADAGAGDRAFSLAVAGDDRVLQHERRRGGFGIVTEDVTEDAAAAGTGHLRDDDAPAEIGGVAADRGVDNGQVAVDGEDRATAAGAVLGLLRKAAVGSVSCKSAVPDVDRAAVVEDGAAQSRAAAPAGRTAAASKEAAVACIPVRDCTVVAGAAAPAAATGTAPGVATVVGSPSGATTIEAGQLVVPVSQSSAAPATTNAQAGAAVSASASAAGAAACRRTEEISLVA